MELSELKKYELVNSCETIQNLKTLVKDFGDVVGSRNIVWSAEKTCNNIDLIVEGKLPINHVTRAYGLRQQLMYLLYYNNIKF